MKRGQPLKRTTPLTQGKSTLSRTRMKRKPRPRPKSADQKAWETPHHGKCGMCGHPGLLLRHHVIYRQHLRAEGQPQWDLRDAFDIGAHCDCHELHHKQKNPIPLVKLSDKNLAFAFETCGASAYDYLRRRYAGYDPRVELLLAEHDARRANASA